MRIRRRHTDVRPRAVVAVAAMVLLAATACDNQPSSTSPSSSPTLSMAVMGTPDSLAAGRLAAGQQQYVWSALYDTLLLEDNNGDLQPGAAQSWHYSSDARTLTLKLRAGMKFSSGDPVTASAVKASLDMIRTTGSNQTHLAAVKSVQAPDARTVVVGLSRPDASLLDGLANAGGVIADPKTMKSQSAALNPVGSGPYTLDKKATVNGSVYVLNRRKDYWNAKAYPFDTVKIRVISDRAAAVNALKSGQINAGSVEVQQLGTLKSAGFQTKDVPAVSIASLIISDRKGELLKPLGDIRVRKALNMAFDRDEVVKRFLQGAGKATVQMFNPQDEAYAPGLDKEYPHDPAGAKKLLAQAGYPDGFSVTMPSLVFTKPFEPTITQSLADIGVKVKWDPVPSQRSTAVMTSRKYPMLFVVDGLNPTPVMVRDYLSPHGFRNPFASTDPELTRLMAKADSTIDRDKANAVYQQISQFAVRNAWESPVMDIGMHWVMKKGITYIGDGSSTQNTIRKFGVSDGS